MTVKVRDSWNQQFWTFLSFHLAKSYNNNYTSVPNKKKIHFHLIYEIHDNDQTNLQVIKQDCHSLKNSSSKSQRQQGYLELNQSHWTMTVNVLVVVKSTLLSAEEWWLNWFLCIHQTRLISRLIFQHHSTKS